MILLNFTLAPYYTRLTSRYLATRGREAGEGGGGRKWEEEADRKTQRLLWFIDEIHKCASIIPHHRRVAREV